MATRRKQTGVIVLAREEHQGSLASLKEELKKKGLKNINVLEETNMVTGTIDPDKIDALRHVKGVEDVLPDEEKTVAGHGASAL